jgi:hypothetical protein
VLAIAERANSPEGAGAREVVAAAMIEGEYLASGYLSMYKEARI